MKVFIVRMQQCCDGVLFGCEVFSTLNSDEVIGYLKSELLNFLVPQTKKQLKIVDLYTRKASACLTLHGA